MTVPPTLPTPLADGPTARHATRILYPEEQYLPVRLALRVTPPGGLPYALTSFWETRHAGRVQRTTIEKNLTLSYELLFNGMGRLTYLAAPPMLRKPDPSALEKALVLLASLYQRLELLVSADGQLLSLQNHAAILETWQAVQQEMVRRSGGEDEVTQVLLTSLSQQLQDPASLLESLRYDYAFALLLPDFYQQRFESGYRYEQLRVFPRFFADADLWVSEQLEVGAPAAPGQATLHLRGTLDASRTDLAAVAQQVDAERAAAGAASPPTDPAALHAGYEATYQLDQATGWPLALDASVWCQAGSAYRKEYFLRLEQLPTP